MLTRTSSNCQKHDMENESKGNEKSGTENVGGTVRIPQTNPSNQTETENINTTHNQHVDEVTYPHHVTNEVKQTQHVEDASNPQHATDDVTSDIEEDDWSIHDDSYETISGEESDIEDNIEFYPVRNRPENPDLPKTCSVLNTKWGSKIYLVGTTHFSLESQADVSKVIEATQPDVVSVELCKSRINVLQMDEETILREAKDLNFEKVKMSISQNGFVQGILTVLFLNMSAHLTKELGMAPGGEFRQAYREAKKIQRCKLHLGDRPIEVTFKRLIGSLSVWQKIKLAWNLLLSNEHISKEDVEKFKEKDLLEQCLAELTGELPALSKVMIDERDTFLANSLKLAAEPIPVPSAPTGPLKFEEVHLKLCSSGPVLWSTKIKNLVSNPDHMSIMYTEVTGYIPAVVVGVVGIGHVAGIKAKWDNDNYNIEEIMEIPKASLMGKVLKYMFKLSVLGIVGYGCCYGCYKLWGITIPFLTSFM